MVAAFKMVSELGIRSTLYCYLYSETVSRMRLGSEALLC